MTHVKASRHPASFRDPHGYVFEVDGVLLRTVEAVGERDYQALIDSGLYDELTADELLVRHEDLGASVGASSVHPGARVLQPVRVPVVSYAVEWTFSQLRDAALLTLDLQSRALRRGMSLRDASSFNVLFAGTRPVFIDTLSFESSSDDGRWVAYRQFCEHFLGPLALIATRGHEMSALSAGRIDGIALATASRLLPPSSWLRPGLAIHLHLHALAARRIAARPDAPTSRRPGRKPGSGFGLRLVESLRAAVEGLAADDAARSPWNDYRGSSTYTAVDTAAKSRFVRECVEGARPSRVLDLGANDGLYSAVVAECGVAVTAIDADAGACESVYRGVGRRWPHLVNVARVDLVNPTPAFGWAGEERSGFVARFRCDLVLALALVHHLSITGQIPLSAIARGFAALGAHLIVEYVPADDPMARCLMGARSVTSAAAALGEPAFLAAFDGFFEVVRRSEPLAGGRVLFWMRRRCKLP